MMKIRWKESLWLGLSALGLVWYASPAEANFKLNLCVQGVRLSCNTAINRKKFKTAQEKQLWLNNCISLGVNQCKVRLGVKKPIPRRDVRRGTSHRGPLRGTRSPRTTRPKPSRKYCRSTCVAEARARMKRKLIKSRGAARTWIGVCFKQCRSGHSVGTPHTTGTIGTRGTHKSPTVTHRGTTHGRRVPSGQCRSYCTNQARLQLKGGAIKSRGAARVWVSGCVMRCRKGKVMHTGPQINSRNHQPGPSAHSIRRPAGKGRKYCASSCRSRAKDLYKAKQFKTRAAARAWIGVCFKQCMR